MRKVSLSKTLLTYRCALISFTSRKTPTRKTYESQSAGDIERTCECVLRYLEMASPAGFEPATGRLEGDEALDASVPKPRA